MKFIDLINEAVQKNQISQALRDPNFQVGIEFEFIINDQTAKQDLLDEESAFNFVQQMMKYRSLEGEVKEDKSIIPENNDGWGIEIVTPVMSLQQSLITIPDIFELIEDIGYTNRTTGLHINLSHKNINHQNIDPHKLASSLEDERIYKTMPERRGNMNRSTEMYYRATGTVPRGEQEDKFQTMHFKDNYVEMRGIGGKDYHKKWPEIKKMLLNYAVKYYLAATDPSFQSKKMKLIGLSIQERKKIFDQLLQNKQHNDLINNYMEYINEWFHPSIFDYWLKMDMEQYKNMFNLIFSYKKNEQLFYTYLEYVMNFLNYLPNKEKRDQILKFILREEIIGKYDKNRIRSILKNHNISII